MPMIIAVCGIDGSGKTTFVNKYAMMLEKKGLRVKKMKLELNNQKIIEQVFPSEMNRKGKKRGEVLWERIGVAFDFVNYYLDIDKINDYDVIICDRYDLCYLAYSRVYGIRRRVYRKIKKIYEVAPIPNYYIYFDISTQNALKRIEERGEKISRDEHEEILERVQKYYKELIATIDNCIIVDATKSYVEILEYVVRKLEKEIF